MSLMSSFKLPCGTKNSYPEKLDYLTRKGKVIIFHSPSSKVKKAYIVSPKHKGVEFIVEGSPYDVVNFYESINLEEHEISDIHGVFVYKMAESREDFDKAFEKFVKKEE